MKRVLLAGFMGDNNSAKVILDKCSARLPKLYLENDSNTCASQMQAAVVEHYDLILILGQKPDVKAVYIERMGRSSTSEFQTSFDFSDFAQHLKASGYSVKISDNAGNYLCNHVYYHGLKDIYETNIPTEMLFVHIPYLKNILDTAHLADAFTDYLLNY